MSMRELIDKATTANVVAGISILAGLYYLGTQGNIEGVTFIVGGAIGYLFGQKKE